MKEGNELHGVDQGLNYYWIGEHAMQALGYILS